MDYTKRLCGQFSGVYVPSSQPDKSGMEADMSDKAGSARSGGVDISGFVGKVGGDIVGRDKIEGDISTAGLDAALRPLMEAIKAAPPEHRDEAERKIAALKQEASKGEDADDGVMAKLVNGLVGLVPAGASAMVSAFASPILGGIAGPVTRLVLDKLQGK